MHAHACVLLCICWYDGVCWSVRTAVRHVWLVKHRCCSEAVSLPLPLRSGGTCMVPAAGLWWSGDTYRWSKLWGQMRQFRVSCRFDLMMLFRKPWRSCELTTVVSDVGDQLTLLTEQMSVNKGLTETVRTFLTWAYRHRTGSRRTSGTLRRIEQIIMTCFSIWQNVSASVGHISWTRLNPRTCLAVILWIQIINPPPPYFKAVMVHSGWSAGSGFLHHGYISLRWSPLSRGLCPWNLLHSDAALLRS